MGSEMSASSLLKKSQVSARHGKNGRVAALAFHGYAAFGLLSISAVYTPNLPALFGSALVAGAD